MRVHDVGPNDRVVVVGGDLPHEEIAEALGSGSALLFLDVLDAEILIVRNGRSVNQEGRNA